MERQCPVLVRLLANLSIGLSLALLLYWVFLACMHHLFLRPGEPGSFLHTVPLVLAPQLLLLVANRVGELGLGDLAAFEGCDIARAASATEVVVDAEERERNHDQEQNELRDPLVLGDEIEHGVPIGCEKGELAFAL